MEIIIPQTVGRSRNAPEIAWSQHFQGPADGGDPLFVVHVLHHDKVELAAAGQAGHVGRIGDYKLDFVTQFFAALPCLVHCRCIHIDSSDAAALLSESHRRGTRAATDFKEPAPFQSSDPIQPGHHIAPCDPDPAGIGVADLFLLEIYLPGDAFDLAEIARDMRRRRGVDEMLVNPLPAHAAEG